MKIQLHCQKFWIASGHTILPSQPRLSQLNGSAAGIALFYQNLIITGPINSTTYLDQYLCWREQDRSLKLQYCRDLPGKSTDSHIRKGTWMASFGMRVCGQRCAALPTFIISVTYVRDIAYQALLPLFACNKSWERAWGQGCHMQCHKSHDCTKLRRVHAVTSMGCELIHLSPVYTLENLCVILFCYQ